MSLTLLWRHRYGGGGGGEEVTDAATAAAPVARCMGQSRFFWAVADTQRQNVPAAAVAMTCNYMLDACVQVVPGEVILDGVSGDAACQGLRGPRAEPPCGLQARALPWSLHQGCITPCC
jgi:hypothetical protein